MRVLVGILASLSMLIAYARPAAASCAAPGSLAENASRATAVIYGTVTSAGNGSITLRVDRVLKGTAGPTALVFLGPGRGGTGGAVAVTSVDYAAAVSTDHLLYLIRGADGQLETNACIGSHPGQPTPDEAAFFGAGIAPVASPEAPPQTAPSATFVRIVWPWLVALLVGAGALWVVLRRRSSIRET
jgi:hypothetical protein